MLAVNSINNNLNYQKTNNTMRNENYSSLAQNNISFKSSALPPVEQFFNFAERFGILRKGVHRVNQIGENAFVLVGNKELMKPVVTQYTKRELASLASLIKNAKPNGINDFVNKIITHQREYTYILKPYDGEGYLFVKQPPKYLTTIYDKIGSDFDNNFYNKPLYRALLNKPSGDIIVNSEDELCQLVIEPQPSDNGLDCINLFAVPLSTKIV